ncbi:hypothetical protein Ssi03_25490 [Sphaerisporangium siamense]|uniref:Uncharacterized protein n=1 Tax=Sphaerisporangium siamense TaxID=795645 RepID=A0A7W7D4U8_9ACTN|nr:hypothetical protein [Sphaerisporangium siamense]MBB4700126.1 hypothetical protein [Sphaerisporangium siamense]GII84559.1 hypothetical protein Ssi03_25490 [Sphaerisporangium siamense]
MQDYKPGERLRITLEATVYHVADGVLHVAHDNDQAYRRCLPIPVDQPGVTITRIAPAEGMPKPGELWETALGRMFVVEYRSGVALADGRRTYAVEEVLGYGPMAPLYRDPEEPMPADEEAAEIRRRLREAGGDSPKIGELLRRAAARTAEDERWPVDEPEPVPIAGVAPGTVVTSPEWADGAAVRIEDVEDLGASQVKVCWKSVEYGGGAGRVCVAEDFPVTIVEEPQP